MKVTKQMLDAAMRKAVEAGLLPRSALRQDSFADREVIRLVLEAATAVDESRLVAVSRNWIPSWRRFVRPAFPVRANGALAPSCVKRG